MLECSFEEASSIVFNPALHLLVVTELTNEYISVCVFFLAIAFFFIGPKVSLICGT